MQLITLKSFLFSSIHIPYAVGERNLYLLNVNKSASLSSVKKYKHLKFL